MLHLDCAFRFRPEDMQLEIEYPAKISCTNCALCMYYSAEIEKINAVMSIDITFVTSYDRDTTSTNVTKRHITG